VAKKIIDIFQSAGIGSGTKDNLYQKIQRLVTKRKQLVQQGKTIKPLMSELFPAAACCCYQSEKCASCPEKHWRFLKDQATARRMTIQILHLPSRADYHMRVMDDGTPVFELNVSNSQLRNSRVVSGPVPQTSPPTQRSPRFISAPMPANSSFEAETQSQSSPSRKRRRPDVSAEVVIDESSGETIMEVDNSYNTCDIALTAKVADAYSVSPQVAAHLINSYLVDVGLMRSDRVLTRKKIIDQQKKNADTLARDRPRNLIGIQFDGRRNKRKVYRGKDVKREFISVVSVPENKYVANLELDSGSSSNIADRLEEVLEVSDFKESLRFTLTDGCKVNTGSKGGVNIRLERKLNRSLTHIVCKFLSLDSFSFF